MSKEQTCTSSPPFRLEYTILSISPVLVVSDVFFFFFCAFLLTFDKTPVYKQCRPWSDAASDPGLHCLPRSYSNMGVEPALRSNMDGCANVISNY